MFYLIGLGLGDCKDITVKGLEIIKKCDIVYLEAYTSVLTCGKESLEQFYGKKIQIADREHVEESIDEILENATTQNIALLVVGDPFSATTHTDLALRATRKSIKVEIVHNTSIMNAVGCCGLQLYNYGETISIPFWTDTWQPDSFFDKMQNNYRNSLHTLCLLDIKVKEQTLKSLTSKKKEYMPAKFMTVSEASQQLLQIINKRNDLGENTVITPRSLCVGLARIGSQTQKILCCNLEKMSSYDLGPPLHSLVIASPCLHPLEKEYLEQFVLLE